jgi:uracil-DNA glycosylase
MSRDWMSVLTATMSEPWYRTLTTFVEEERARHEVYPAHDDVFAALRLTPPDDVRVVILGQDPYHGVGQANGLAFSVPDGVVPPPSLRNVFTELHDDLGCALPESGDLGAWARDGVLLLNSTLTVRAGAAASHAGRGWETFTDRIIAMLGQRVDHCVFILWGRHAGRKASLVADHHTVIASAHPSPLSARNGFFGSRPFSRANAALAEHGQQPVDWATIGGR